MSRQQDAAREVPPFTQLALPEANRVWVGERRELVEQEDLGFDAQRYSTFRNSFNFFSVYGG